MTSFDAAFAAAQPKPAGRAIQKLTADPRVTTREFEKAFTDYVNYKGSTDLWSLLCPPPGAPLRFDWKSKPHGEMVLKVEPLLWAILELAPNTKVLSTKIISALKAMAAQSPSVLTQNRCHKNLDDALVKIDVTLRILMAQLRQLRVNTDNICNKTLRILASSDSKKLTVSLGRIELPEDMLCGKTIYDMAEECGPGGMGSVVDTDMAPFGDLPAASRLDLPASSTLALVLHTGIKSRLADPPDWAEIMKTNMVMPNEIQDEREAALPSPPRNFRRGLQCSEADLLASADSFLSQNLSVKEKKKTDQKSKDSEQPIKKKQKKGKRVKKGKKVKEATPIAADEAKDTLIRSASGQKPPESLRKSMLVAPVQDREAFHSKWGCTKCAWKRCTPSCWKSKNMKVP